MRSTQFVLCMKRHYPDAHRKSLQQGVVSPRRSGPQRTRKSRRSGRSACGAPCLICCSVSAGMSTLAPLRKAWWCHRFSWRHVCQDSGLPACVRPNPAAVAVWRDVSEPTRVRGLEGFCTVCSASALTPPFMFPEQTEFRVRSPRLLIGESGVAIGNFGRFACHLLKWGAREC